MSASKLEKNIANLERRMREEFRGELARALSVQTARLDGFEARLHSFQSGGPQADCHIDVDSVSAAPGPPSAVKPVRDQEISVVPALKEAWTEEVKVSPEEPADADDAQMEPVAFLESSWNLALVLGHSEAGWIDVTIACLLLLTSAAMQGIFSFILLWPEFRGDAFSSQIEVARAWRRSVAHDYQHMDLARTSLVSRVCNNDGALILSTDQAAIVNQINNFLGLSADQFDQEGLLRPGVLLSMLCILLWSLYICNELRIIWLSLEAVAQVPRRKRTSLQEGRFLALSCVRFWAYCLTRLLRAAIACILLYAGVLWLGDTPSITDLMLNAVALGAVLSVDDLIFAALMPKKLQIKIQDLEALKIKYSRRRSQVEAVCILLLMGALMAWSYLDIVHPLAANMETVKRAYCAGNQDFVVGANEEQQVTVGFITVPHAQVTGRTLSQLAVEEFLWHDVSKLAENKYIHFQTDARRFEVKRTQTMAFMAEDEIDRCEDWDAWYIRGEPPPYSEALDSFRAYFWSAAAALGEPLNSTCQDMAHRCDEEEARVLRLVCGVTCGCSDRRSFPIFRVAHKGCTRGCREDAARSTEQVCTDVQVDETWTKTWDDYPLVFAVEYGVEADENSTVFSYLLEMAGRMKALGCAALAEPTLATEIVTRESWCEGIAGKIAPLAGLCPETCGCTHSAAHTDQPAAACSAACHPSCVDIGYDGTGSGGNVSSCSEGKEQEWCHVDDFAQICARTCERCDALLG